jgi:thioredoxin-like negative regulator of GroEL
VERAARLVRERQLGFNVARIDAPSAMDVSEEYGVNSLPAFILFRDGVPIKFPSLHTAEAMIAGAWWRRRARDEWGE